MPIAPLHSAHVARLERDERRRPDAVRLFVEHLEYFER